MKRLFVLLAAVSISLCGKSSADEFASDVPKPIPATRPEIKVALDALKRRAPRLPLPPATGDGGANNGRMRTLYLPETWQGPPRTSGRGAPGQRGNNSAPTLDFVLTTSCFWIVSRGNNCHYCLGHQELKLAGAGVPDDTIAALDVLADSVEPRTRAALVYARKLTLEPQLLSDRDIAALRDHFTDEEIIELTFVISRFNATNRWTDGMGIPQDSRFGEETSTLLTPTSDEFRQTSSVVTADTRVARGPLPDAAEIVAALDACRTRTPRVTLPSEADAQAALGDALEGRDPLAWERALAILPEVGKTHVETWRRIMNDDHLEPRLKAELAYITAVNNRAWYAAGIAARRLSELGASPQQFAALVDGESPESPGVGAAYRLAAKLTTDPHLITDMDIASVRQHFSDPETAQIVHVICMANLFDRFTEALGLPL